MARLLLPACQPDPRPPSALHGDCAEGCPAAGGGPSPGSRCGAGARRRRRPDVGSARRRVVHPRHSRGGFGGNTCPVNCSRRDARHGRRRNAKRALALPCVPARSRPVHELRRRLRPTACRPRPDHGGRLRWPRPGSPRQYLRRGETTRRELLRDRRSRPRGSSRHRSRVRLAGPLVPLDAHFAFGNFIADALSHRTIVVRGDGTPLRSYLYASDLVRWLWALLVRAPIGRPYNVGSDVAISVADLARTLARTAGVGIEIRGIPTPGTTPDRYVPSIDRARRELGLEVRVDLAAAVQRTLSWYASR